MQNILLRGLRRDLNQLFNNHIQKIYPHPNAKQYDVVESSIADYQTASPFAVSKLFKLDPQSAANTIIQGFPETNIIKELSFSKPGFINIVLQREWISEQIFMLSKEGDITLNSSNKKEVLIDFASPNMCKELHVGHLRSVVLGESLSRILTFLGHNVEKGIN